MLRRNADGLEGAPSTLKLTESLEKEDLQLEGSAGRCVCEVSVALEVGRHLSLEGRLLWGGECVSGRERSLCPREASVGELRLRVEEKSGKQMNSETTVRLWGVLQPSSGRFGSDHREIE